MRIETERVLILGRLVSHFPRVNSKTEMKYMMISTLIVLFELKYPKATLQLIAVWIRIPAHGIFFVAI